MPAHARHPDLPVLDPFLRSPDQRHGLQPGTGESWQAGCKCVPGSSATPIGASPRLRRMRSLGPQGAAAPTAQHDGARMRCEALARRRTLSTSLKLGPDTPSMRTMPPCHTAAQHVAKKQSGARERRRGEDTGLPLHAWAEGWAPAVNPAPRSAHLIQHQLQLHTPRGQQRRHGTRACTQPTAQGGPVPTVGDSGSWMRLVPHPHISRSHGHSSAPDPPPTSSSCPNASRMVRCGA